MQGWFYDDGSFRGSVSAEVRGGRKKHVPIIRFLLIVASRTDLAACLVAKPWNHPQPKRVLRCQLLLSPFLFSFSFFSPFFFSLGCYFSSAFKFSTSPPQSGLRAHTPLHKLNSPLFKPWQAFSVWMCIAMLHSSREGGGGEAAVPGTAVT